MSRVIAILLALRGVLPLVFALVVWQIVGDPASPHFPPPGTWAKAMSDLIHDGSLMPALLATVGVLLLSLLLACLLGFALGLLIGTMPWVHQWTAWLLEFFRATPPPVLIPVIVLMLGYTLDMKLTVIVFAGIWPVLLNTIAGVSQIRGLTFDVARSLRLSRSEILTKIIIPATVPALLVGIRVALPHTIIITLVVEMFTGAVGIGGLMIAAERNYNAAGVFGLLVLVGLLGFAIARFFAFAEILFLTRWPRGDVVAL
jgi:ABC-type nitrate/sulfonate/bicarbonate transport system permease component